MVRAIDENGLIDIANILQKMVGAEKRFTKFEDVDLETNNDLRTCVATIVRVNEDKKRDAMSITPDVPNLGNDRAQDNWLPLFM